MPGVASLLDALFEGAPRQRLDPLRGAHEFEVCGRGERRAWRHQRGGLADELSLQSRKPPIQIHHASRISLREARVKTVFTHRLGGLPLFLKESVTGRAGVIVRGAQSGTMPCYRINDQTPDIDSTGWVAPSATVVGAVMLGANSSVFYGAVLRADTAPISVGAGSNIQDTAVVHADPGFPATIGNNVSVGHGAVLHGCTVQDGVLVGMNATVLNGAVIGAGSLVAANALVLEGTQVPPGSLVAGVPAKVRRALTPEEMEACADNARRYQSIARTHAAATPV